MKNANKKAKPHRRDMIRFLLSRRFPDADDLIRELMSDAIDVSDDASANDASGSDPASNDILQMLSIPRSLDNVAPPVELVAHLENLERLSPSLLSASYEAEKDKERPFSKSSSYADLDIWLRKDHFSSEEAVALSYGLEPTKINLAGLKKYTLSPFAISYRTRHDELQRYAKRKKIDGLTLGEMKTWMDEKGFEFPRNWPVSTGKAKDKNSAENDELHQGTRDIFYKLLIAVCVKQFGYKPSNKDEYDPHITSKVRNYIKSCKFEGVSEKTVRDHIRAAEQHFAKNGIKFK